MLSTADTTRLLPPNPLLDQPANQRQRGSACNATPPKRPAPLVHEVVEVEPGMRQLLHVVRQRSHARHDRLPSLLLRHAATARRATL